MISYSIKTRAQELRSQGKTYEEIRSLLGVSVSKGTLSGWCSGIKLPKDYIFKRKELNRLSLEKSRIKALESKKMARDAFLDRLTSTNQRLVDFFRHNNDTRKITLAVLYLAEGSKSPRGALMFGNSDASIIGLFMNLMRECYEIDESKFRVTVQCRADQSIPALEKFWSEVTSIPLKQFYKARVDRRTLGQKSKKADYRGVCRIDYFSSFVDLELKRIAQMILL